MEHDRLLLPDRAGLGLGRRGAADPRAARRRRLRAERHQAVHLRRRRLRPLRRRWCAPATTAPSGISALLVEKDAPGLSFGAQRDARWAGTRSRRAQVIFDGLPRAGREPPRRGGHGLPLSPWPGSTAGGSTSPPARSAARRRRSTRRSPTCASARPSARRSSDFQALQFRLADMATELRGRAHLPVARRRRQLDAKAPGRDAALRHGQALRHRRRLRGRQRGAAAARRLRLPRRLRHREDRARPARAPDPRRHQRDHARDHRARA